MKKYDWKKEYNPIRRTAKRILSGDLLKDGETAFRPYRAGRTQPEMP